MRLRMWQVVVISHISGLHKWSTVLELGLGQVVSASLNPHSKF